jgi:1-phosphatidylinositol-3-phosphate 5-kinase
MESLHREVYDLLHNIEKSIITEDDSFETSTQRQITEMKDLLNMERNEYEVAPLTVFLFVSCFMLFSLVLMWCDFSL